MYVDDVKLFAKNDKELETLIHGVKLHSPNIEKEFSIENLSC